MKGSIYKIESKINKKVYIGLTTRNPVERWHEHRKNLKYNCHPNVKLQRHYNKYGDVFEYKELGFFDSNLTEREKDWIAFYNSYKYGFNLTPGGELTEINADLEVIAEIKKILYFNPNNYKQITIDYELKKSTISSIRTGGSYATVDFCFKDYDDFLFYQELSLNYYTIGYKKLIDIYNKLLNGEKVFYKNYNEIEHLLYKSKLSKIRYVKYIVDYVKEEFENYYKEYHKKGKSNTEKILLKYIEGYTMKEISQMLNLNYSHINRVINNKKSINQFPELRKIITNIKL